MAGLAALCAAAALLLAGAAGQTPISANFGTNYGVPSPPAGYGNGNDCYLNKVEKVIVTVQANDPVSAIAPTPVRQSCNLAPASQALLRAPGAAPLPRACVWFQSQQRAQRGTRRARLLSHARMRAAPVRACAARAGCAARGRA